MFICCAVGCKNQANSNDELCSECTRTHYFPKQDQVGETQSMSEKYPQYYKPVGKLTEIDVYAIHQLFDIKDPSGAIQHASKKLLLSGVRTGGKSQVKDIKEARDTLTRWLQLNEAVT